MSCWAPDPASCGSPRGASLKCTPQKTASVGCGRPGQEHLPSTACRRGGPTCPVESSWLTPRLMRQGQPWRACAAACRRRYCAVELPCSPSLTRYVHNRLYDSPACDSLSLCCLERRMCTLGPAAAATARPVSPRRGETAACTACRHFRDPLDPSHALRNWGELDQARISDPCVRTSVVEPALDRSLGNCRRAEELAPRPTAHCRHQQHRAATPWARREGVLAGI